jgi:hypothetical protein
VADYESWTDEQIEQHLHRRCEAISAERGDQLDFRVKEVDDGWSAGFWTRRAVPEAMSPDGAMLVGAQHAERHLALVHFAESLDLDDLGDLTRRLPG